MITINALIDAADRQCPDEDAVALVPASEYLRLLGSLNRVDVFTDSASGGEKVLNCERLNGLRLTVKSWQGAQTLVGRKSDSVTVITWKPIVTSSRVVDHHFNGPAMEVE